MIIDKKTIQHVANLSRLILSEQEEESMRSHLQKILESFADLQNIKLPEELGNDARSALSLKQAQKATEADSRMEADVPNNSLATTVFLAQTPTREGVFVRVPAILNSTT